MLRHLAACLFALAPALTAQDVRELSSPTGHYTLVGVTAATINTTINAGYRLVDIDYRGTSLLGSTYDVAFVQNAGAYSEAWWWYAGLTSAQVGANLAANNARLIDLDPYEDASGNVRFNCVMVDNTGANYKPFWWYVGTTTATISAQLSANTARLVDLDNYTVGGATYYAAVMIPNTGADARAWWWYLNATPAQIGTYVNNNGAQLYDLEPRSNGNFDCVMVQNPSAPAWYWWTGISASQVAYLLGQYGVRAIDIDSYLVGSTRVYALVGINNSNALTTAVGNLMRARTGGQVGCWLQQLNGANFANLNGDTQFEPASTMKTLHHVHAMRQVSQGLPLTTNLTVYSGYNGSCPQDTGPYSLDLQTVLQRMMENSDNACTQAVRVYFGESSLNATAAALGMAGTSTNHRLGCPEAATNPNRITLRDLNTLHTQVVNGHLGAQRPTFYQLMNDSVNDLTVASIIGSEGAALGLTSWSIGTFRNLTRLAHKGGNYALTNLSPAIYHRCEFGYLSLPFLVNGVVAPREYGFGAFVNDALVDADAQAAIYTDAIPELLRPQIRAALQSWVGSLASFMPYGSGCGGMQLQANAPPHIGSSPNYITTGAYAGAIALAVIGFSDVNAGALPLPFNLTPFGGEPGCVALTDIQISLAAIAGPSGIVILTVPIPNDPTAIGFQFFTQFYSFGPSSIRSSNGVRNIVGL